MEGEGQQGQSQSRFSCTHCGEEHANSGSSDRREHQPLAATSRLVVRVLDKTWLSGSQFGSIARGRTVIIWDDLQV